VIDGLRVHVGELLSSYSEVGLSATMNENMYIG